MWSTTEHVDDEELMLAADGELAPRQQAALDAHTADCAACRTRRDQLATTLERVSAVLQSESAETTTASPYGRVRLAGALRAAAQEDPQRWMPFELVAAAKLTSPLAVAIALVLVLAAGALLGARARQGRVEREVARASLPVPELTPGAVSTLSAGELCAGVRPSRLVPDATRRQVLSGYGMADVSTRTYELDALVTPELGGTTDAANLWPQRYQSPVWNASVKDQLERLLPELVCSGRIDLAAAQRALAADWVGAYKRFFETDRPLHAHLVTPLEDEPELVLLPPVQIVAQANAIVPIVFGGR